MYSLTQLKQATPLFLTVFVLGCFAFAPQMQAVVPPPDGGYPNFTTAEGTKALQNLTTGSANTGLGWYSLFSVGTGSNNTAVGAGALALNTADGNTATGVAALILNTTGARNTANGAGALVNNDSGTWNGAVGAFALTNNIDGSANNAFGESALRENIHAHDNTAIGDGALFGNDATGNSLANFNTAVGSNALVSNNDGSSNTAIGHATLSLNIDAGLNTAVGDSALFSNQTGSTNTAVFVNSDGKLGTNNSSKRFKENIQPMDEASEAVLALKPVTFHYKRELDPNSIPQFGLVAEDVEKVNPDLVARDRDGKPYTVRYEAVNAMLLNEFLKEHRKVEQQESKIDQQEAKIARQQQQIEALTVGLQKVSAQFAAASPSKGGLELSKAAPQTVLNNW